MSVAEIKAKAKDTVHRDARGASALSLIKTARSQMVLAKECESKSELKGALSAYIKAASLASLTVDSPEHTAERGKGGAVRKEVQSFIEEYASDMNARAAAIEEMLKNTEKQISPTAQKPPSLQDRMRALQDQGLDIGMSSKRMSRDSSIPPSSPLSPKRISTSIPPSSNLALLSTLSPPTPISSTSSQHTIVSPATLGPPSPSSSPSSSPLMENMKSLDIAGFTQAFPSIDELNEDLMFNLPQPPKEIANGKTSKRDTATNEPPPIMPSIRDFVPMERPSSTPVPPVTTTFMSRPASPVKPSVPRKPSNLAGHVVAKPPIPMTNSAFPDALHHYMHDFKVLLIDIRNRQDFHHEHIKANAIVCIEPYVLLRESVSEQSLEDAMVIAPKEEQSLFMNRDKFDLVAVYDQNSISFGGHSSPLNILVRAIMENAFRRMLKRAPMMLVGGLDAWKKNFGDSELVRGDISRSPQPAQLPTSTLDSTPATVSPIPITPHGSVPNGSAVPAPFSPSLASQPITSFVDYGSQSSSASFSSISHPQPFSPRFDSPIAVPPSPSQQLHAQLIRRPPAHSQMPNSVSLHRTPGLGIVNGHPIPNGLPSAPITYPQVPRRISPTASGSNPNISTTAFSPQPLPVYQSITSPPQASINISRKRSDYVDQSQEALSTLNNVRTSIDYPEIALPQIPRPPPAAAPLSLERQDKRVQHMPRPPSASQAVEPKPPRIESDYPATYWSDLQVSTSGLKNMGNTCYMNAPVQCLSATVPFARFFLDGRWKTAINFMNPMGSKGKLAGAFAKLVQEMWMGDLPYLTPFEFRKSICQLRSEFIGNDQHDSQEFLTFLLDGIHEDLNRIIAKPHVRHDPEQEAELERMPGQIASEQEWRTWRTRNDSLIVDFFQGQFRSQLECLTCHKTSTTYNVFSILQLPIPHAKSGKVPIERCLAAFFGEEVLDKDNSWDCPICKVKRRATKRLSLARLPPILVVQLKRFEANGRFSDKIDTFVDYPTKFLDLTNYMPPPLPPGIDKTQLNGGFPMSSDDPRVQLPPYRYELYAVTNHYGNLSSGHYTAFIASRGGWMYCDDSSVKSVDPRQVVNQKAYLLFYKRVKA
ncbi:ubiquitin carboxyl-terminal hydrolase 4 [Amanita muscaria]